MAEPDTITRQPALEDMFATKPVYEVPSTADRYRYKKVGGSSDTAQTADVFN
ncbi:MAG: hypothetical protein ACRDTM_11420 [Micromonosporaceae bacterium]